MVESKVLTIIKKRLRQYAGTPVNQEKLAKIREDIYKGTRKYKSAPFATVKKWVKEARADMASSKNKKTSARKPSKSVKAASRVSKSKAKSKISKKIVVLESRESVPKSIEPMETPKISQSVKRSLAEIKSEIALSNPTPSSPSGSMEISARRTPMVLDKVYLQSMSFEMASMRQALDRIGRQLDKLERELSAHREGGD